MYSKIFNFSHKLSHGVVTVHRKAQKEGVDRINWANDEMKNTLHESIEKTKEAAERTSQTDVVKASIGLIDDIVGSIKKFEIGDTVQIITGVLDIVNALSQFASFADPAGTAIAEITGPLYSVKRLYGMEQSVSIVWLWVEHNYLLFGCRWIHLP